MSDERTNNPDDPNEYEDPFKEPAKPEDEADQLGFDGLEDKYGLEERDAPTEPSSVANRVQEESHDEEISEWDDSYDDDLHDPEEEEGGMSFLEHLEEFRWTVARSALAVSYTHLTLPTIA